MGARERGYNKKDVGGKVCMLWEPPKDGFQFEFPGKKSKEVTTLSYKIYIVRRKNVSVKDSGSSRLSPGSPSS